MDTKYAFVVTGASQGLGAVLASEAFKKGFPVALIGRDKVKLEKVKGELSALDKNKKVSIHSGDLTDEDSSIEIFQEIEKLHGGISVLVNNAGIWTGGKTVMDLSRLDIQKSLDLNFFTAFNATKEVLDLRKPERDLCIINIGATSSLQGWDNVAAFSLGKGALRIFSQSLAREMGPQGVHVAHLIIDGLIDNPRTRALNSESGSDKFINMTSIAQSVLHVACQDRSCWTFEWDIRPYNESW